MDISQNIDGSWFRVCSCGRKIVYSNKKTGCISILRNKNNTCRSCWQEGVKNRNFGNPCVWNKIPKSKETIKKMSDVKLGKKRSDEVKEKLSLEAIKRYSNQSERKKLSDAQSARFVNVGERKKTSDAVKKAMHRPDVRKKHLDALHHSKWIKVRTDKGQLELLKKWNRMGFLFEPNYQLKTDQDLFYIDGYDKEKNVVLEFDSEYHSKPYQQKKDLVRQNKIIYILKPNKFWRYNSTNKQFKNVLGD
jgi:hypothetical protein